MFSSACIQAQEDYFSTLNVRKFIKESHKWELSILGHFKSFHSKEGWTRVGLDFSARRRLNQWDLYGGIVSNNTLDKTEANYWELRPWLGLGLTNTVYGKLKFNQLFKFEWRNLIFSESSLNKITTRYRYRLKPFYDFKNNWSVYSSFEWYILPNKNLGTRFINSNEWSFGVTKKLTKVSFTLNYSRENFNKELTPNASSANTITFTAAF